MPWGWVKHGLMFIVGWTNPLKRLQQSFRLKHQLLSCLRQTSGAFSTAHLLVCAFMLKVVQPLHWAFVIVRSLFLLFVTFSETSRTLNTTANVFVWLSRAVDIRMGCWNEVCVLIVCMKKVGRMGWLGSEHERVHEGNQDFYFKMVVNGSHAQPDHSTYRTTATA